MRLSVFRRAVAQGQRHRFWATCSTQRFLSSGTHLPPGYNNPNLNQQQLLVSSRRKEDQPPSKSSRSPSKDAASVPSSSTTSTTPTLKTTSTKHRQDTPRRIVVKRNTKDTKVTQTKQEPHLRRRRRQPPLQQQISSIKPQEIRDSWGQAILMAPRKQKSNNSAAQSQQSHYPKLPILNASALLHTRDYCVHSANSQSTLSGTGAARRLLQGQADFLQVLRQLVHVLPLSLQEENKNNPNTTKKQQQQPQFVRQRQRFVLQGHGIPHQLLQEHIQLADALLKYHNHAVSCAFHTLFPRPDIHQNTTTNTGMERWMRVRQVDGSHRVVAWPPPPSSSNDAYSEQYWTESMQLFLTVFQRLVNKLGVSVLVIPSDKPEKDNDHGSTTTTTDHDNNSTNKGVVPHHWNVEFSRHDNSFHNHRNNHNDPDSSSSAMDLRLTVEWTPIDHGPSAPGHIRLQLQGTPIATSDRDNESSTVSAAPVRLAVDASFRYQQG